VEPNVSLSNLVPGHSPDPARVIAGSLFECQYRLFFGDGNSSRVAAHSLAANPPEDDLSRRSAGSASEWPETDLVRVIEHSLLWQTTGKGDRDFGIHLFERRRIAGGNVGQSTTIPGIHAPAIFRAVSPLAPLSYQGQLISIEWLVRIRVFLQSGKQLTFEQKFALMSE
jgi:hypothetical protein